MLRVGILGAGRMAQGYDNPGDAPARSLANAISQNPNTRLVAFFDPDEAKVSAAESKWGLEPSPRDIGLWLDQKFDIICIASPTEIHSEQLRMVAEVSPQAILLEKPVSSDIRSYALDIRYCGTRGVPVFVDFPRRYHPVIAELKDQIQSLGDMDSVSIVCTQSMTHNGIHALDLVDELLPVRLSPYSVVGSAASGILYNQIQGREVGIQYMVCNVGYYIWSLEIRFQHGRVAFRDSPEEYRADRIQNSSEYVGTTDLKCIMQGSMEDISMVGLCLENLLLTIESPDSIRDYIRKETYRQEFLSESLGLIEQ